MIVTTAVLRAEVLRVAVVTTPDQPPIGCVHVGGSLTLQSSDPNDLEALASAALSAANRLVAAQTAAKDTAA